MLPPATEAVWGALRVCRELAGFTLIGGTALALQIGHRLSEDLDLVWAGGRLPSLRIRAALDSTKLRYERHDNPAAVSEFADSGLELHDHQQDYLVAGVKVSFFAADTQLSRFLSSETIDGPRVATLSEIFASKCLVSALRSRTRDWFDLFVLLRDHGFSLHDYALVFEKAGDRLAYEVGLTRLCSGTPDKGDEGFHSLAPGAPSIEGLADYFRARRDEFEVTEAAARLRGSSKT
jgi:hypothetical protein